MLLLAGVRADVLMAERRRAMASRDGHARDQTASTRVLTFKEGQELFDRRAKKELGISGEEFLRRWDAGEYRPVPDTPEGRKVGRLVMLMPFAGRTKS
jgi:hypothetical protein